MKKLFALLALCAPIAVNGMEPAAVKESDEAKLAGAAKIMAAHEETKRRLAEATATTITPIIRAIQAKLNDGTLSIDDVEAYRKSFGDGHVKARALANLFDSEFGATALQRLKDFRAKVNAKQELSPEEKRVGKALSTLAAYARTNLDATGVDFNLREAFTDVNREALKKALGVRE